MQSLARQSEGERIDGILGTAHTLPDGRRVFKTGDGSKVFDEHGREVAPETLDPKAIDGQRPKWETFRDAKLEDVRLTTERQDLLVYQGKLDRTRDGLDKGGLSERDLERMQNDLASAMPDRVRRKLDADDPAAPARQTDTPLPVKDMDAAMRKTGLAPATPGAT